GIEEGYALPDEATNNIFEMTPAARAAARIEILPHSRAEALDVREGSTLVQDALGEHVFDYFIRNKRREWDSYKEQVTPWELARYLEALCGECWERTAAGLPRPGARAARPDAGPRGVRVEGGAERRHRR